MTLRRWVNTEVFCLLFCARLQAGFVRSVGVASGASCRPCSGKRTEQEISSFRSTTNLYYKSANFRPFLCECAPMCMRAQAGVPRDRSAQISIASPECKGTRTNATTPRSNIWQHQMCSNSLHKKIPGRSTTPVNRTERFSASYSWTVPRQQSNKCGPPSRK